MAKINHLSFENLNPQTTALAITVATKNKTTH